jgi:hypothetical protein
MEIFEQVAWISWGFVPTLALLEIYERVAKRRKIIPTLKLQSVEKNNSDSLVVGYSPKSEQET